jgi:type I restriction enzyme M protein
MNPPFGGKEGKEARTHFDYKTGATQVLFLQHVIRSLKEGGRCGIVLDEGLLFRANQDAFVKTKQKLLNDCNLWCIVSMPAGVFTAAGAGVKTNLLFFTKGKPTKKIWYYDLTDFKVLKKTPLMLKHFEDFFQLLPDRADSPLSWTVDIEERKRLAADEAQPFKDQAHKKSQEAAQWNDRLKELKKTNPRNEAAVIAAEEKVKAISKEAKEAQNKAKEIEDAVYDLKAVNPNKKPVIDTRTPEELLDIIETKGREIQQSLETLRKLNNKT